MRTFYALFILTSLTFANSQIGHLSYSTEISIMRSYEQLSTSKKLNIELLFIKVIMVTVSTGVESTKVD